MNRCFSTTRLAMTPPKYKLPTKYKGVKFPDGWSKTPVYRRVVTPNFATPSMISSPPLTWTDIMAGIPSKTHSVVAPLNIEYPSIKEYYQREQAPIRYLQRLSLPTTFAAGETIESWRSDPQEKPLSDDKSIYPYTYYRICLKRGMIGLEQKTKSRIFSLGLHVREQVVYKRISPEVAGSILAIKELVDVKLCNSIPPLYKAVAGYTKIGNAIGKRL